jgi:hypothetical protein
MEEAGPEGDSWLKAQAERTENPPARVHKEALRCAATLASGSTEAQAEPNNAALAGQVAAIFKGTALRAMLLDAYGWWKVSQIMYIVAITAFTLGGLALIGSVLTLALGRRPRNAVQATAATRTAHATAA